METDELPQVKSQYGLDELPTEILNFICAELCPHCGNSEPGGVAQGDVDQACFSALGSLSLTSRRMRAIAQPFMFHQLSFKKPFGTNLIRFLLARPEIAASVQTLDQKHCVPSKEAAPGDLGFMYALARRLGLENASAGAISRQRRESISRDFEPQSLWDVAQRLRQPAGPHSLEWLLRESLIGLLPNLRTLAVARVAEDSEESGPPRQRVRQVRGDSALSNLRKLKLEGPGVRLRLFTPANMALINAAASSLRVLVISRCKNLRGLSSDRKMTRMPNLRAIEFRECDLYQAEAERPLLRSLIEASPRLERFTYTHLPLRDPKTMWGESDLINPTASLLHCVQAAKTTLKHLEIDLTLNPCMQSARPPFTPEVGPKSLVGFTALEGVTMSTSVFCQCFYHQEVSLNSKSRGPCLKELLGPVAQTLKFVNLQVGRICAAWIDIAYLGEEVAHGAFPKLQRLEIQPALSKKFSGLWEETKRMVEKQNRFVLKSFKTSSVELVLLPPKMVDYQYFLAN